MPGHDDDDDHHVLRRRRRRRRQTEPTAEQMVHFHDEILDMKQDMAAEVSNLTCAMRGTKVLNEDNMVDIEYLRNEMWTEVRDIR